MLWKKESLRPDSLYVDMFTPNTQKWDSELNSFLQTIDQTPHPKKSDTIALQKRNEGNEKFRECAPLKAMKLYSDSLRFAKPGSEHISLAYANRAASFLNLKMYDECLMDIELATKAGYPEHLKSKLEERKVRCLKEMQEDEQHPREKLSFHPNEKFPYLSNMVKVQRNGKGDYSLIANTDIDVGQTIAVEDPYAAFVWFKFEMHCNICSKEFCNLVPCKKCAVAMFCPECQGHFLHEYECGLNFCGDSDFNRKIMEMVRSILLTVKLFPTVDELMSFVEQMLMTKELPESMFDDRSKFQAFFNFPLKKHDMSLVEMKKHIYPVFKTLLRIPHVNEMFRTEKHRRFLMHLIGHHKMLPEIGAGTECHKGLQGRSGASASVHISPVMLSYFTHSCRSNVLNFTNGGKIILYSSRLIKNGEQLTISLAPRGMESTKKQTNFIGCLQNKV